MIFFFFVCFFNKTFVSVAQVKIKNVTMSHTLAWSFTSVISLMTETKSTEKNRLIIKKKLKDLKDTLTPIPKLLIRLTYN